MFVKRQAELGVVRNCMPYLHAFLDSADEFTCLIAMVDDNVGPCINALGNEVQIRARANGRAVLQKVWELVVPPVEPKRHGAQSRPPRGDQRVKRGTYSTFLGGVAHKAFREAVCAHRTTGSTVTPAVSLRRYLSLAPFADGIRLFLAGRPLGLRLRTMVFGASILH